MQFKGRREVIVHICNRERLELMVALSQRCWTLALVDSFHFAKRMARVQICVEMRNESGWLITYFWPAEYAVTRGYRSRGCVAWTNVECCRLAAGRIGGTKSKPHEEPLSIIKKDERYLQSIKFKGMFGQILVTRVNSLG